VTRPDVLISGGDDDAGEPRQLPVWLRRGVPAGVVLVLLVVLGVRLVNDQRSHQVALEAADAVEVALRLNETGVGVGASVLVGIQVSGRGGELRVDAPQVRSADVVEVSVTGAPTVVDAGTGQQIRLRLQPDCGRKPSEAALEVDVPVTPESGKRRVLHVPFPEGPDLLRRACGFLSADEALTTSAHFAIVEGPGERLVVQVLLRNDGRERLTVTGVAADGLDVTAELPVVVPPREKSVPWSLVLRLPDCGVAPHDLQATEPLRLQVADAQGRLTEVVLTIEDRVGTAYHAYRLKRCS
jgi:hypothetical protein